MYTEPEIVQSPDLRSRAYVKVYIDGHRYRFYNGKQLGINCNPNKSKTARDRERALNKLSFTVRKKLEAGWLPESEAAPQPVQKVDAATAVLEVLRQVQQEDLSGVYKRDLRQVSDSFLCFLKENRLNKLIIQQITANHVNSFLDQYCHSATYYMNKRRALSGIFSRLVTRELIPANPVRKARRQKESASLHEVYTKEQLSQVLAVLRDSNRNLYVCALLMYGCFLRPHREIRKLRWSDFNQDHSRISLGGDSNKSKRVRTVHVPEYVRQVVTSVLRHRQTSTDLVFPGEGEGYNESYFNTTWSRIKAKLVHRGLISSNHTLYSFRHTAAVNLYLKTRDLYKVQQAMGHSNMQVTLTYMRSLGAINPFNKTDVPDNPEAS